jgi:hypothetical protein
METAPYLERRLAKDPSIVARRIADELILVPIRHRAGDVESIYTMNEVACRIWELIDGQRQVHQIRDVILEEYDVGLEEAEADLVDFLQQLAHAGAVKAL